MITSNFFQNIQAIQEICETGEVLYQVDANLPGGLPVRIMKSDEGYHVAIAPFPITPPAAVSGERVIAEIFKQWHG